MSRAWLLPLALLAGCQATSFEQPPLAALPCDPELVGSWLSRPESEKERPGEIVLDIGADCRLGLTEKRRDGSVRRTDTQLQVGRSSEQRYAWLPADWDWLQFEPPDGRARGDVFVLRYAVQGRELELWLVDSKAVAHLAIDGRLRADVEKRGDQLLNRVTGEPQPEVLDLPGFFADDSARFIRAEAGGRDGR